jgi:HlyD family secretion protein
VEPEQGFEAHAPLATTVAKVLVREGQNVHAGALLLTLDDSQARAALANAQTRLAGAQAHYAALLAGGNVQQLLARRADIEKTQTEIDAAQRQLQSLERLQKRGAASDEEVSAAQDRLARAKADLAQLQTKVRYSPPEQANAQQEIDDARSAVAAAADTLRRCQVRAPFNGTVYYIPARAGAFVNLGDLLLEEADLSRLRVRAYVDEPEIGHLALSQDVQISWDALPGHLWHGTVTALPSTVLSRGSRVVGEVLCSFENTEHLLLPNVNVSTTIIAGISSNTITVPREAIHEDSGHNYVFVVKDMHLQRRDVKLGIANLTRVEVLTGLTTNDVVAVQDFSPSPMSDGIRVKIVENPA